jgi:hypothetical protein
MYQPPPHTRSMFMRLSSARSTVDAISSGVALAGMVWKGMIFEPLA